MGKQHEASDRGTRSSIIKPVAKYEIQLANIYFTFDSPAHKHKETQACLTIRIHFILLPFLNDCGKFAVD